MGCFNSIEHPFLSQSHNTTAVYRDSGISHWTLTGWAGLSICGKLDEEREWTKQEALWCFYHQNHGAAVSTPMDVTDCGNEMRTMATVTVEMMATTTSAC
eukprot:scaffold365348_cov66-Attheya_sp.AAC.2